MSTDTAVLARDLAEILARDLPGPLTVSDLRLLPEPPAAALLSGGAAGESWSFDVRDAGATVHPLLLRRDYPDGRTRNPDLLAGRKDALDRASEFALLRRLYAAGAAVPRPVAVPRPDDALRDCYLVARPEGEITSAHELRTVRQVAAELARIHSFTVAEVPFFPQRPLADRLELVRELLDIGGPPRPALEAGLRWCRDRLPALGERPMCLVHGDFRPGNFVIGPDGLQAVLGWERAHLGDPAFDLGHACLPSWHRGSAEFRADFLAAYHAAGGAPVEERDVHFGSVLSTLITGGIVLSRTIGFRSGAERTVESAAVGRRIAVLEYDLLALLDT
ncbi:phosphotransferase family protein [Nocardia sp. NPDC048505]|uniref:phosphotransferase family protein n=1 Tax=unclassified Nocardia TaxID=2637762 RepID=UPI0033FAA9D8